jgi:hypothetical protein
MYIKDIQKYTKLHICPKCGYIPAATNCGGCYRKDRFEEHVENCNGNLVRKYVLTNNQFHLFPISKKILCLHIF